MLCCCLRRWQGVAVALLLSAVPSLATEEQPGLLIQGNVISRNGLGVYMGWGGDWNVHLVGNTIEWNGEGVRIVNPYALIEGNTIAHNVTGLLVTDEHEEKTVTQVAQVVLRGNLFDENQIYAVQNVAAVPLIADGNWWGSPDGPRWADVQVPNDRRVWLWTGWFGPATAAVWGGEIALRASLTRLGLAGIDAAAGLRSGSSWTWLDSLRWGLPVVPLTVVFVTGAATTLPRGNVVTGLLQLETWLPTPP